MSLRILHTIGSLDPSTGGPARSVPQLAAAQAALGHDVMLWTPESQTEAITDAAPRCPARRRLIGPLAAALDAAGPVDLLHDHGLWNPLHHRISVEARRRRIPRVVSPRGMLEPWALHHKAMKKRVAWGLYQRRDLQSAAGLHATAQSEADQFRRLGLTNRILIAANGVHLPEDFPEHAPPPPNGPRTALFLSRIQKKKGLPMLVQAWAQLRPEGWVMRVVGPDEDGHRAEVEALVRAAGLSPDWRFHGELDDTAKWQALKEADLFILPTHSENFGMVVAEALAAGRPVITTQGAPWEGLVTHGCGWWTDVSTAGLLAALREACASDRATLQTMGRRGRQWMEQSFSWEEMARMLIAGYETLLRD